MPKSRKPRADVFLNVPYDKPFQNLCLAYISGISAFGLVPRATLEIPANIRRLDRILKLIRGCQYSVHDLSRVELDAKRPPTPRFNMPFELGLCVAWARTATKTHSWFVYESKAWRLSKSLSDLDGTDPYIHMRTVNGVFRELCNAFVGAGQEAHRSTNAKNQPGRGEESAHDLETSWHQFHLHRQGLQGHLRGRYRLRRKERPESCCTNAHEAITGS